MSIDRSLSHINATSSDLTIEADRSASYINDVSLDPAVRSLSYIDDVLLDPLEILLTLEEEALELGVDPHHHISEKLS